MQKLSVILRIILLIYSVLVSVLVFSYVCHKLLDDPGGGQGGNYASPSPLLFTKNDENAEFIKKYCPVNQGYINGML